MVIEMCRNIKADLLKIYKSKVIYVLAILYTMIFTMIFFQYTVNKNSNVIEEKLMNPTNLYSLFLFLFGSVFNIIFCIAIISYFVAREYENNTIQMNILLMGRYKCIISKMISLAVTVFLFIIYLVILGVLLGLYHDTYINMKFMVGRVLICFLSTYILCLFIMLIATITKSTSKSMIICTVLFLGQIFLPAKILKVLSYLIPYTYLSSKSCYYSDNLRGMKNFRLNEISGFSSSETFIYLSLYIVICMAGQIIIMKQRSFD